MKLLRVVTRCCGTDVRRGRVEATGGARRCTSRRLRVSRRAGPSLPSHRSSSTARSPATSRRPASKRWLSIACCNLLSRVRNITWICSQGIAQTIIHHLNKRSPCQLLNEERPHMSLGDLTPAEFKKQMGTTHGWLGESLTGVILQ